MTESYMVEYLHCVQYFHKPYSLWSVTAVVTSHCCGDLWSVADAAMSLVTVFYHAFTQSAGYFTRHQDMSLLMSSM